MKRTGLFLALALGLAAALPPLSADVTTQPSDHKTDLLGPKYTNRVYGIEFRPPLQSSEIDKATPDTIVEFDRDDYNWRLKAWRVRLQRALPLTVHNDQFGRPQDGVIEITLANIKQQTPDVQVLRNEVINVGRIRVGMIAVRYETANHERRLTQQAIFEAADANFQLYYFLDLTGPGKPASEPDDIVNPAEKLAYDTFSQVVDSVVLLDRTNIAEDQKERLYHTIGLFMDWNSENGRIVQSALAPEQYQRIIKDGQDVGYQYIVEDFDANSKAPEMSTIHIGVRSRLAPTPLVQWDTQTSMTSSIDRKHEHFETSARCTNNKGELVDSFSQIGTSDEQTKAVAVPQQPSSDGSLLPSQDDGETPRPNPIKVVTVRSLEATTTHRNARLGPFKVDVPVFYVPQAFSYLLPSLLPLQPKTYMFATYVPGTPQNGGTTSGGNVMSRYMDVLPVQHVKFHGQEFDAIPINDKVTLEGTITTYYMSPDGKFLGSTSSFADGDKTSTIDILPTDAQTLARLWNQPDLSRPADQPADNGSQAIPPPLP